MNRKLLIASLARTLARTKTRTFLMSLGVIVGVAALVVTRSFGARSEQEMLDKVAKLFNASNILVRAGGGHSEGPQNAPLTSLEIADIEAVDQALDEVIDWDPFLVLGGQDVIADGETRRVAVYGHSERSERVWARGVSEGETISEDDVRASARVALLGPKTANALFGDESPIGRSIRIGNVPFRVKGVLEPYGMDPHGMDRDDIVDVPITTLMRRMMNVDYIAAAKLVVADPQRVEETADRVIEILRERHGLARDEPNDFTVITPALVQTMVARMNRIFGVFLPAAAAVILLVAAIVIANVMSANVRERLAEIGLRKAVGASDGQIGGQFLAEAVVVTTLSGLLGIALAGAVLGLVAMHGGPPATPAPDAMVLGLATAVAVGVLAGFLPARRAARLDPVAALR